jgi:hypothetical protein
MNTRIEGSKNLEIVPKPTNPKPDAFWSYGYGKNWIGNGGKEDLGWYWRDASKVFP